MKTKDFRSLGPEAQETLRRAAVSAVLAGESRVAAARRFGVTRQAVGKWVRDYESAGEAALRAKRRGRPRGGSLAPWQAAQTAKAVVDRCPDQLKLPFYLWTREAVADLIERKFAMRLSVWTVGRYLKRWGFTPQKPVKQAFERNPQAVQRWLEEEYPAVRAQAKADGAQIWLADEMGLRSDHTTGTSYAPRGRTPVIAATGKRFGCSMISGVTNRGRMGFSVFHGRFTARTFIDFLARLLRQAERNICVIVDSHPVHRARKVREWITAQEGRVRLVFLPGYSPDLNPDEMLNQDVKANAVGRHRPHTRAEMVGTVRRYLFSTQKQPHIVRNYFQEESVRYAAV
jgi:transposase